MNWSRFFFTQRGTPVAEASDKNNHPHIVLNADLDDESDVCGQFLIAVEQNLMLECSDVVAAT